MLWDMLKETLKKQTKHWGDGYGSMDSENIIFIIDSLTASIKKLSNLCLICMALGVATLMAINLSLQKISKYNSIDVPAQVIGVLEYEASILSYIASYVIYFALFLFLWLLLGKFLLREIGKQRTYR